MIQKTTLFGFLAGMIIIGGSIIMATENPLIFFNVAGLGIVLGGIIATVVISNNVFALIRLFTAIKNIFVWSIEPPRHTAARYVEYARIVNESGLSALESELEKFEDEKLDKEALEFLLAGYKKEEILNYLDRAINEFLDRESENAQLFKTMAKVSPAYGMIGTVVGLIVMLYNMGDDVSSVGPSMAIALVTTFYGVLFSTAIFGPFADKITRNMDLQLINYRIMIDGISLVMDKRNPVFVRDALSSHLLPRYRRETEQKDDK
jgi:chemotaxis protein MotA